MTEVLGLLGGFLGLCALFRLIDLLHSRWAWRQSVREADALLGCPNCGRGKRTLGVPACAPAVDVDGEAVTPQRLIDWLDVKFSRHGEEEDKWAADYIRATLGVKEGDRG